MKAIIVHEGGGPEVLRYEEHPDPVAADGELLVRLEAAGINHFDLNQRQAPEASGTLVLATVASAAAPVRLLAFVLR